MLSLTLALTLVAAPPSTTLRLGAAGLATMNVDPKTGAFLAEHLASQMKLAGAEVVTQREIEVLLGLERQKALLGCNEESTSCAAEMASALGVDGVLVGELGKLGARYVVNVKIIGSRSGKTAAVYSETVDAEDRLSDALSRAAKVLAPQAGAALGRSLNAATAQSRPPRLWALAPLAVAVVAGGAGTWAYLDSRQKYDQLARAQVATLATGTQMVTDGTQEQRLGVGGLALAGAALVAAGVLWWALAPTEEVAVTPTLAAGPSGAFNIGVGGSF